MPVAYQDDDSGERFARLSGLERRVFELIAEGHSTASLAESLGVGCSTARTHIQSVLTKLEVHSKLAAATLWLHGRPGGGD
jgi:two-component system nitrate/nitrite response regulator NarL